MNPQFVQKVTGAPSLTEWAGRGGVASSIRCVSLCPEAISGRLTETYSLGTFPDSRLEVCLGMRVGVLDLPPLHTGWRLRGRRCPGLVGNPWPGQTSALPLSLPSRAWGHRKTIRETSHPVIPEASAPPEFQRSLLRVRGRCREGSREDQARLT